MNESAIRNLLKEIASGQRKIEEGVDALRTLPFEAVDGFAKVDHHRGFRRGVPEAIYCAGKTAEQVGAIFCCMAGRAEKVLGTRATAQHFEAARALVPDLQYDPIGRCIWIDRTADAQLVPGVLIVTAGTSDIPVAAETAITLQLLGLESPQVHDVGVAGIHRLLAQLPALRAAKVLIVIAGMEGALPSAVAGLAPAPIIAVPTSVGYGASFGGLAALLGMLSGCAPGVGVVNIDNGFGAACLAASILSAAGARSAMPSTELKIRSNRNETNRFKPTVPGAPHA
jgi:NCAIR mutase (PurE)-related protein